MFFRELIELLIVFITTWSAALHVSPTTTSTTTSTPTPVPTVPAPVYTSTPPGITATPGALRSEDVATYLEILCNETRQGLGLNRLNTHAALEEIAWIRAQQIPLHFSHETENGSLYVYELAQQANVTGGWIGEVLARVDDSRGKDRIWELWMASPPHREVILGQWDYMAASVYHENGTYFAVMVFWDIP